MGDPFIATMDALKLVCLASCVALVNAHGALYKPTPRNAMDNILPEYANGKSPTQGCACTNGNPGGDFKTGCDGGLRFTEEGLSDGQACLWWNQGCSIGCHKCMTEIDPQWSEHDSGTGGNHGKIGLLTRYCNASFNSKGAPDPLMNATLPRHAWTLNMGAVEGSKEDVYRYNPWRAPGYAPVVDPCGMAGGKLPTQDIGGDSVFVANKFAKMGDLGSNLPPSTKKEVWKAGSWVEVGWGPLYNHGGGYQYRLCSAKEKLTEECFQKKPLEFDQTKQTLVWNTKAIPGANSKTPAVTNGTLRWPVPQPVFVNQGTWPKGSTWARDPIPRVNDDNSGLYNPKACPGPNAKGHPGCLQFPAPCPWDTTNETGILPCTGAGCHGNGMGSCSSDWVVGMITDQVWIPKDIEPGDWVLSWRWDAEETAQIWANCADVTITVE